MTGFRRVLTGLSVAPLQRTLAVRRGLFDDIPSNLRNAYPGSSHSDTATILLRWCFPFTVRGAFEDLHAVDYPAVHHLSDVVAPLIEALLKELGRSELALGRAMINRLPSAGRIAAHVDEGLYAQHFQRFHIVVASNANSRFRVGDEWCSMLPGEAWWFDHQREHEVVNDGDTDRVHLIVDVRNA